MQDLSNIPQLTLSDQVVDYPSSSSDRIYQVLYRADLGAVSCNCPGYIYKRQGQPRGCKHTRDFMASRLMQVA